MNKMYYAIAAMLIVPTTYAADLPMDYKIAPVPMTRPVAPSVVFQGFPDSLSENEGSNTPYVPVAPVQSEVPVVVELTPVPPVVEPPKDDKPPVVSEPPKHNPPKDHPKPWPKPPKPPVNCFTNC